MSAVQFPGPRNVFGIALDDIGLPSATEDMLGPAPIDKTEVQDRWSLEEGQATPNDQFFGSTIDSLPLIGIVVVAGLDRAASSLEVDVIAPLFGHEGP